MARVASRILRDYLLGRRIPTLGCLRNAHYCRRAAVISPHGIARSSHRRPLHTRPDNTGASTDTPETTIAYRKLLKDEAKKRKAVNGPAPAKKLRSTTEVNENWELTVGIEIHAQLNTARKLFSAAASTVNDDPNTQVELFDLAIPGAQPAFQKETLIPALRAALALNCEIQPKSQFDRKHYFHWDQPAGYQITQYYQPFAKNGYITLYAHDGIAKEDGEEVKIGIKQIQMEQDTAKTLAQPGDIHLLDFNRVGLPLVEIITLPQIHTPSTAAAVVKKIQMLLNAVDACVLGMESGGLRADVNVSVRRRDSNDANANHGYADITGLGQRTEIKNLSSFKAVRDAIIAERDRQIGVLEEGGIIEGETRGWTLGSSETKRLRGKEGEVDYRYMPDPDLAPVILSDSLIFHLRESMGVLPDQELGFLIKDYGLTTKDALSLTSLEDGGRVEYFYNVVNSLSNLLPEEENPAKKWGRVAGNWVLHELGGLVRESPNGSEALGIDVNGNCIVPASDLAHIIYHVEQKIITGKSAKSLLFTIFQNASKGGLQKSVKELISDGVLMIQPMLSLEYGEIAREVVTGERRAVESILTGQEGKLMFLVGKMMRIAEERRKRMDPKEAATALREAVEELKGK